MASKTVIFGDWISPGTHIDIFDALKSSMREAMDELLSTASVFVDSRKTTVEHLGEIAIPLAKSALKLDDIREICIKLKKVTKKLVQVTSS